MKAKKAKQKSVSQSKSIGVRPIGDRVLVRPFTEEEARGEKYFGIIIPDTVKAEKSAEGVVLAVGEGRYEDGKLIPLAVKAGDTVLFSKYSYDEVNVDGEDLYILRADSILAVINR